MKKTLLLGIAGIFWLSTTAKAQLEKDTKFFGGTLAFNGYSQKNDNGNIGSGTSNSLSVSPSLHFGKFIKQNRMIGLSLGTDIVRNKGKSWTPFSKSESLTTVVSYSLSPYIRHYKLLSPKWAVFLHSSVALSYSHYKVAADYQETYKNDGYSAGIYLAPGIAYWISPRFALETDLNFLSLAAGYQSQPGESNIYFNSAVTSTLNSYFAVRAAWYIQKQK